MAAAIVCLFVTHLCVCAVYCDTSERISTHQHFRQAKMKQHFVVPPQRRLTNNSGFCSFPLCPQLLFESTADRCRLFMRWLSSLLVKKIDLRCVMYQQVGGIWQTEKKKKKKSELWSAKRGHRPALWGDEIKHG